LAPCVNEVAKEENERMAAEIARFLGGGHGDIVKELEQKMTDAAERLEFERAKEFRDLIQYIDTVMEKQTITMHDRVDRDIFGYATDKGMMAIQVYHMRMGKLIERQAFLLPYYGDDQDDFLSFVTQFYTDHPAVPK